MTDSVPVDKVDEAKGCFTGNIGRDNPVSSETTQGRQTVRPTRYRADTVFSASPGKGVCHLAERLGRIQHVQMVIKKHFFRIFLRVGERKINIRLFFAKIPVEKKTGTHPQLEALPIRSGDDEIHPLRIGFPALETMRSERLRDKLTIFRVLQLPGRCFT